MTDQNAPDLEVCPTCGALPCDRILALRSNPQPGSEGWKLVRVEPTRTMHRAAWAACETGAPPKADWAPFNARIWAAMLAASPTPPTAQPGEVERLRSAVGVAAFQFETYAKLHAAKGTPDGLEKAKRNAELAEVMRAALTPSESPETGQAT